MSERPDWMRRYDSVGIAKSELERVGIWCAQCRQRPALKNYAYCRECAPEGPPPPETSHAA